MPYLSDYSDRGKCNEVIKKFQKHFGNNFTGNLNYFLFKLAKESCKCYADYRDFLGELKMASEEIYRRQAAPHEDNAIVRNGDVE